MPFFTMDGGCSCLCIFAILIIDVTSQQGNEMHSTAMCLDQDGTFLNCSNMPNEQPPEENTTPQPFWCPIGYQLFQHDYKWTFACRPRSCHGPKNVTQTCEKISPMLNSCPKMHLSEDQYEVDGNGTLTDLRHNFSVVLGDYFVQSTGAIICDPNQNGTLVVPSTRVDLPRWCMSLEVPREGYSKSGEGLFIEDLGLHVQLFMIDQNETAHACTDMEPSLTYNCEEDMLGMLLGDEFELLPNWGIRDLKDVLHGRIFPRGAHILAEDKSFAIVCHVDVNQHHEVAIQVNAAFSLLSAVCLLLTILAHQLFPKLNHHAKSLLCLAFSYLVMYIVMAARYFAGNFESTGANLVVFASQYISTLSAFFWLSILAFDFWRAFADLQGPMTSVNTARQKRTFIAKCCYAWGIPTLLCIVVFALEFSPNVQKNLGLVLHLQTTNWLQDMKTMLILLYPPIIIALLENLLFFVLTIVNLRKASKGIKMVNSQVNNTLFRVYIKLFVMMGLGWLAEIISGLLKYKTGPAAWYATDAINCLQGVFIFLIYICKKDTLRIIKTRLGKTSPRQTQEMELKKYSSSEGTR